MVLRFYVTPPQIPGFFYVKLGCFGTVLGIFGVGFVRALCLGSQCSVATVCLLASETIRPLGG